MPTIPQQIDYILDMRLGRGKYEGAGRLQKVTIELDKLKKIRESVTSFHVCVQNINSQINNQSGEFYKALYTDPNAMAAYSNIDCNYVLHRIDEAVARLEELRKRFSRESVRIAFIGYEGQGKSTFIQSMTGLENEIIPTASGTSCTGAVSVIHNVPKDRLNGAEVMAEIKFFTVHEFLTNIQNSLNYLFPEQKYMLTSLDDLSKLHIPDIPDAMNMERAQYKALINDKIVAHLDDYKHFLGASEINPTDKDVIMSFVAQYREYKSRDMVPLGANSSDIERVVVEVDASNKPISEKYIHKYYKYLAVKSVDIYCPFPNQECGKVEFADTVGLGPTINASAIKQEMFRVLNEDCDGAITVLRPSDVRGLQQKDTDLFKEISDNLNGRDPKLWMSLVINKVISGGHQNIQNIGSIKQTLGQISAQIPFKHIVDINGLDRQDVNDNLLIPHLSMIGSNLEVLDSLLIANVQKSVNEAVNSARNLLKCATEVIPMSSVTDWKFETDGYQPMLHDFNIAMNDIDHDGYARAKDVQCRELTNAYEQLLTNIDKDLPSEEDLLDRFRSSNFLTPSVLFEEVIEEMRNGIFEVFENVNMTVLYPLQEKVKGDIIKILYNQGKMSQLPLSAEYSNIGPSVEWLERIILEYIPQEKYPALYEALRYILDYKISIEGTAEYYVTESLHIIEKDHQDFIGYSGPNPNEFESKAACVWQELANRLMPLQKRLRSWMGEFSLQPSLLSYSRVHKFHIKIGTNANGVRDFKDFYYDNMGLIWHDEIEGRAHENMAFTEWIECIDSLRKTVGSQN